MFEQLPGLSSLSPQVREIVLRVLAVVIVIILIYLSRRLVTFAVLAPFKRLAGRTHSQTPEKLAGIVGGPVRLLLIAAALLVTARIVVPGDAVFNGLAQSISRIFILIAVLMLVYRSVDIILPTSAQLASLTGIVIQDRLLPFIRVGLKIFIVAIGGVIILQEFGYDVTGLIAGLGVGGLALSLAAQDTVANLFGFASIIGDSPFSLGDYIRTPDVEGTVEHVGVRSTRVRQSDETLITIPNNVLANSAISNFSRMPRRRIDFTVGVTYRTTAAQMRVLLDRLRTLLKAWPSADPSTVQVYFSKFNDSSLDILVRCYVRKLTWDEMMTENEAIMLNVMEIVEELGLSIAFPTRSLVFESEAHVITASEPVEPAGVDRQRDGD
ncbi:MAG: mechanosensitive ion channel family protein [Chloroflexi bacterium]|nr:mechanosensitive ion channel family protein [Chloroflexota bacterium]MDL1914845.1 mechanosensitive ion channel family protein [Anaerolineae bacterium CFX4]